MITKEQVIDYLINLKEDTSIKISDILYDDITHSLTFKELQQIDHLRTNMNKLYNFIYFLEKEID